MNEIAEVEFETNLPLFFDAYAENRSMGALILIDGLTNATVGAAMIVGAAEATYKDAERTLLVLVPGRTALAERVRDALGAQGERAVVIDDALISDDALVGVVRALQLAGVVAVSARVLDESVLAQLESFAKKGLVVGDGLDEDEILRLAGVTE